MFLISISLSNKVPAAVGARHAMETRVTAVWMAIIHGMTIVYSVLTLAARRVPPTVGVIHAKLATTWMVTGVTSVVLAVRRVQVPVVVIRVALDTGYIHVTPGVLQGVKETHVVKMTGTAYAGPVSKDCNAIKHAHPDFGENIA